TPACKFAQQKLLGQTENNMEAHAGPEVSEYKPSTAIRIRVVGIGKRSGNQTATPLRIIRLRFPIVSLADKWSHDGVPSPRTLCPGTPIEIPRVLMQERRQNGVCEQALARAAGEVSTESQAISFWTLAIIGRMSGLLDPRP